MSPPVAGELILLGTAKEIASVLRELKAGPEGIIRQAGLDPDLFDNRNNAIPLTALGRLFAVCVARTHCPHIGLLVGQRATLASLGLIGGVMQHSPTVGAALGRLVSHLHLLGRGAVPILSVASDRATLSYAIYQPGVAGTDQISDWAIATNMKVLRALCGHEWAPDEILLPRHAPADPKPYRRFFQAPVRFDEETAALVFPARWLEHPIPGADVAFRRVFEERVQELEAAFRCDLEEDVRRTLRTRLLRDRCSAETVAALFAMHRRTLNWRLRAEDTGFRQLMGEIRFEVARQLLTDTTIPLGQIAAALGYSEACAFTRAFRRWSGRTPSAWRADARPGRRPKLPMAQTVQEISPFGQAGMRSMARQASTGALDLNRHPYDVTVDHNRSPLARCQRREPTPYRAGGNIMTPQGWTKTPTRPDWGTNPVVRTRPTSPDAVVGGSGSQTSRRFPTGIAEGPARLGRNGFGGAEASERLHSRCIGAELPDCITARRNVLTALWAGRLLGLSGEDLTAYASDGRFVTQTVERIMERLEGDLRRAGVAHSSEDIRRALSRCHHVALHQACATD